MLKIKINKITVMACCLVILAALFWGCSKDKNKESKSEDTNKTETESKNKQEKEESSEITQEKNELPKNEEKPKEIDIHGKKAILETEKGTIEMEFYPDDAPITVRNFIKLANKGFYKDMIFHRVEEYLIQTGDPTGTGYYDAGYTIKDEFNERKHLEGTAAMARTDEPDSASSQFYICLEPLPDLDGRYTVFGQVTKGLDVIHKIEKDDKLIDIKIVDKQQNSVSE